MSFRTVLVIISVVGLALLMVPIEAMIPLESIHTVLHGVRTGLAEALIIAVFLAATVDFYVKQRLAEEIARDVSPHMAAAALPNLLRDEIRVISNVNLYRRELEIEYILDKRVVDGETKIILNCKSSFIIKNVAGTHTPYTHLVSVQRPFGTAPELQSITLMRGKDVLDANGKQADYEHDADAIAKAVGPGHHSTAHIAWSNTIWIPGNGEARFISETSQIFSEEDVEMFVNIEPTERTIVKVTYPKDTSVNVTFCHRLREAADIIPKNRPTQWTFEKAMLPYQPVIIEWRKLPVPQLLSAPKTALLEQERPA